jgi:uncharacterized membrane protein
MQGLGDFDPLPPQRDHVNSTAVDVSADRQYVVGQASAYPVIWAPDHSLRNLAVFTFGTLDGLATGVSADGTIVVGYPFIPQHPHYRWTIDHATGMVQFQALLQEALYPRPIAMSASGDVMVGMIQYISNFRRHLKPNR